MAPKTKEFSMMILPENGLGRFIGEAANHPLLTEEQEKVLIGQLDSVWPDRTTTKNWRNPPAEASRIINEIVLHNVRLVIKLAVTYQGRGLSLDDLIQAGFFGLYRGVIKFELSEEVKISTYVTFWIKQSIDRAILECRSTIRIPVHAQYRFNRIKRVMDELETTGESPILYEKVASLLGDVTPEQVESTLSLVRGANSCSLEDEIGGVRIGDIVPDTQPDTDEFLVNGEMSETLNKVLDNLKPREAQILKMRYGLYDGCPQTLEEVGQKFGLTRERIRQIEAHALRRLRHPKNKRPLREYANV